jgi:MOSC domain-containing protein YiiM
MPRLDGQSAVTVGCMKPSGLLVSVNVNVVPVPRQAPAAAGRTGIDKRPTSGRVEVRDNQVMGDHIVDTRHHGGVDQAVYAYAREDAAWWAAEIGRDLPPGSFGENLSTEAVAVTDAVIGERWAVGSAVFEVSCPRIPCRTFAGFIGVEKWIKRFTERGWPGAYLRILTEGEVGAGDAVTVVHRPAHGVTIGDTFRAMTGERSLAPRLLEAPELPADIRERARRWVDGQAGPLELDTDG